jgi:hypothetical protein
MEENKKESESNWLNKLKEGLSNPNADIWKEKQKKDLWEPEKEEDVLFEGQKKFEKIEMTPEMQNVLDEQRIERLKQKAEEEFKRNQLAEKARADHDKKIKAFQKKANAEKKKLDEKIQAFEKTLKSNGVAGFKNPKFDEISGLILTETNRPFKAIFDNNGKYIIGADEIAFGENGLFYLNEKFLGAICLYHYDSVKEKLELLADFQSIKDLHKAIYKQDPKKTLGFPLFMDYNTKKEADEEIRISKLTPAERLKEEKERKKKESETKKAQKQLEKEKKQNAATKLSGLSIDEEFDKLFGL